MPDKPIAGDSNVIFVYGTLRSEFANAFARRLRDEADLLGRANVQGSIFLVAAYPGYQREPDGIVRGELWRLRDPGKTLAALDDYEGPEYSRVLVDVTPITAMRAEPPSPRCAWIYRYDREVHADSRIASGDFLAR